MNFILLPRHCSDWILLRLAGQRRCRLRTSSGSLVRSVGEVREYPSRMLKKSASFVLASLRSSTYRTEYASPLRLLRPCWTAFLSILRDSHLLSMTCGPLGFLHATIVFPQPARVSFRPTLV